MLHATDVYLVRAGTAEFGDLHDAGGGRPNTIVAGASYFIGEIIGLTAPGGKLDEGVYDVVYDTCQDGQFDPGRDTVFHDAVTVELPDVLPLTDGAIGAIKDEARREYYSWPATRLAMKGLFKLADRALKEQCEVGNAIRGSTSGQPTPPASSEPSAPEPGRAASTRPPTSHATTPATNAPAPRPSPSRTTDPEASRRGANDARRMSDSHEQRRPDGPPLRRGVLTSG